MTRRRVVWLLIAVPLAACGGLSHINAPYEIAGAPSATGCDGWFNLGGRSEPSGYTHAFTLQNRSTTATCRAQRVTLLFHRGIARTAIRLSSPPGWTMVTVPCQEQPLVCGVVWSSAPGVPAGGSLRGFGLWYGQPGGLLRIWIIDVGRRRVAVPIGTVGG